MSQVQLLLNVVADLRSLTDSLLAAVDVISQNEETISEGTSVKEEATPVAPATPPVTIEQVRALLADKSRSGKTADVRGLLKDFGAGKLSEVDPKRYAELMVAAELL